MNRVIVFAALLMWVVVVCAQTESAKGGWKLVNYSFIEGTSTVDRVLAGSTDYMEDVIKFEGAKGDITIFVNRYDKSSRKLLAGVTYNVKWTDPQTEIFPGENMTMNYSLKTITNKTWTPEQQSAVFNQGMYGIKLKNKAGEEYFTADFSSELISSKGIEKGYKPDEEKTLTVYMGGGFKAVYTYKWHPDLVQSNSDKVHENINPVMGNKTGWYFTRWEYVPSSADGTKTGKFANGDPYTEVNTATGDKNNFTTAVTRIDKNGKTVAGGKAITTWTDPPSYFSDTELPSIAINRKIESNWGISKFSISFDMKDIKPGGATAGKINFATGEGKTHLDAFEGTLKAPKITKGSKNGDEKAIIFHMNGYGFKYYYEWRVY